MEDRIDYSPSLKRRLKDLCGCFKQGHHHHHHPLPHFDEQSSTPHHHLHHSHSHSGGAGKPRLRRSSSGGGVGSGRSHSHSHRTSDELFHIKDKCRSLINRMGTPRGHHHHGKSHSTDFRYDPLSYALNFDEGGAEDDIYCIDELPLRNFSARLPPSPSPQPPPPLTPQPPPPSLSPPPRQHRHASDGAVPQVKIASPTAAPSSSNVREITAYS